MRHSKNKAVSNSLFVILGDQLYDPLAYEKLLVENTHTHFFMCEDWELCTHFRYHKHKIIFFLSAMRRFSQELKKQFYNHESHITSLHYFKIQRKKQFFERLIRLCDEHSFQKLHICEVNDHFFYKKIQDFCIKLSIDLVVHRNLSFLEAREDFVNYLSETKKPFLNSFYTKMRVKHNVLMTKEVKPIGGQWSYDKDNRKKIPKNHNVTAFHPESFQLEKVEHEIINQVKVGVDEFFPDHPGQIDNFWLPVSRKSILRWWSDYLDNRFHFFGDYQDALDQSHPFVYHSVVSMFLNAGLLSPQKLISDVEDIYKAGEKDYSLNGIEGFIRQVLGWREFVKGIYDNFDHVQQSANFFQHKRQLNDCWYKATTGIDFIDDCIRKAQRFGYCHHIERLMCLSNVMLLLQVDPQAVYRWFMEMFVDSADWVMGPNVFGMGQFSDGGIFATKPYISGSNYIKKMSHYSSGPWCDIMDGLYWQFIEKNIDYFKSNHRMSMMVSALKKIEPKRKKYIYEQARIWQNHVTHTK